MPSLLWFCFAFLTAAEVTEVEKATCIERGEDQHSLLQLTSKGVGGKLPEASGALLGSGYSQDAALAQVSAVSQGEVAAVGKAALAVSKAELHALADTAENLQAASSSANAALNYESQAADFLNLAYKEVQQAEDIQEARVYHEANVTQILHEVVQQVQSASSSPLDASLLESLRQAEMAQATMIKDASQEDRALADLRSTMASAAQATANAKLVDETQTVRELGTALSSMKETAQIAEEVFTKTNEKLSGQRQEQGVQEAQEERAAAKADREKAEVARKEASAMYQAAASTQDALLQQASQTAKSLLKVSTEAQHAAKYLQSALAASNGGAFVH